MNPQQTFIHLGLHLTLAAAWSAVGAWLGWSWLGTWLWIAALAVLVDASLRSLARAWSRW